MSDLEKQASTWVPPWQRPAANPPSDTPPDDPSKSLREAAEQAAARWSAAPTAPPAAHPDTDAEAEADAPTAAQATGADGAKGQTRNSHRAPEDNRAGAGDPVDSEEDGRVGVVAEAAPADADTVADADVPAQRTGGGSNAGDGAAAHGQAAAQDAAEGDDAAASGKKGRAKKAGDGSLKDGMAVAEMLAKALPEQRSKTSNGDADAEGEEDEEDEPENYREYEPGEFKAALEAILMVVDEPVGELVLATVLEARAEDVANALIDLSASYTQEGRGFDLRRAAGGWRFYTRADYASYVERFVLDGQQLRLTQASLETLAVVAYKQPVTRSRISAIRGVNVDGVIRTLITRGMVEECGTDPESGAHLYRTTMLFLEKMGLDSVDQLPPLAPFLPDNLEELAAGE